MKTTSKWIAVAVANPIVGATWLSQTLLPVLLLVPVLAAVPAPAAAQDAGLPPRANVVDVLSGAPAYQAALRSIEAEQSVHRQLLVGAQDWVGSVSAARRTQTSPASERTSEWELGIQRRLRLPGKTAVYDRAGQARVGQAEAARAKVWRDQARMLLQGQGAWLRDGEAARVWAAQVALLRQQLDAVAARQRLGDAARIEQQQAEAALAQAQAQAQAAAGRALAAREALDRRFPGLDLAGSAALPPPQPLAGGDAHWIDAQLAGNPEVELARREADAATAQLGLDLAETRPDPTLGLRVGRARSGAEQTVGVVLSIPFGSAYRTAGAAAAASRAQAAVQQQLAAQRLAQAAAVQRLREAQTAYSSWLANADAAVRLAEAADSLGRGYRLGEGSLSDVLSARRLANDQQLAAATGAVDAWVSRHRLELEAERLWAWSAVAQPAQR